MSKVIAEYQALKTIKERLAFDASGRPGAVEVREMQGALRNKIRDYKAHVKQNIHSNNAKWDIFVSCYHRQSREHYRKLRQDKKRYWLNQQQQFALEENDEREGSPRKLLGLPAAAEKPQSIGGWFYDVRTEESWDNNRYSKSWHRTYGGAKSVSTTVYFARRFDNGVKEAHQIDIKRQGDFVLNAGIKLGLFKPVKKAGAGLDVRLKNVFDAHVVETFEKNGIGYRVYSRTLNGHHYDWCIVSEDGCTFHHDDRDQLLTGWIYKKSSIEDAKLESKKITWSVCRKLGFCETGIGAFCEAFDLNADSYITADDLYQLVINNKEKAKPFLNELNVLAKKFNFAI